MSCKVWILCPHYGHEGISEPFIAFKTEKAAQAAKHLVENVAVGAVDLKIIEAGYFDTAEMPDE